MNAYKIFFIKKAFQTPPIHYLLSSEMAERESFIHAVSEKTGGITSGEATFSGTIKDEMPTKAVSGFKHLVIEGPIGTGKTSLTRLLCDRWKVQGTYEVFEENPFLVGGFYQDKAAYAFNTELFFLLTRFRQQRNLQSSSLMITDYLFDKSLLFSKLTLTPSDFEIYKSLYEKLKPEVKKPDLVIFLQADLETLLRRIYFRDRKFERDLSPIYLETLMSAYYRYFLIYAEAPVLTIDTTQLDFVSDPSDFLKIASLIEERLQGQVQLSFQTKKQIKEQVYAE